MTSVNRINANGGKRWVAQMLANAADKRTKGTMILYIKRDDMMTG